MWISILTAIGINAEVVVASLYRSEPLVADALLSIAQCASIEHGIHVYGYNPLYTHPAVKSHAIPSSPFHNAYRWLHTRSNLLVPTKALANGNKEAYADSRKRAFWRTSLNLDAWFVLSDALSRGSAHVVIWMENDGFINDCALFDKTLRHFVASGADGAACYGKDKTIYRGQGAVCVMFLRSALPDILEHVIGYHMVQPFDWILSDFAQDQWITYNVASHGRTRKRHKSTLH